MITHSPTFENLANAPVKQVDVVVVRRIIGESGWVDDTPKWQSSDVLMSVNIDSVGEMLGTATKKAKVKTLGIQANIHPKDLFQIRTGIYNTTTSEFEYITVGTFIVDTVDYDYEASSTTVNLYDAMWTASHLLYTETVVDSALEYPGTVEALAEYVAQVLSVDLMTGFASLPNSQYEITQDLYANISQANMQNVIQDIAGATGTTARITDNTLVFSQYLPSSETLDSANLKTLKIGDTYGPVTSVILGRQPQNDNIAIYSTFPTPGDVTDVNTSTDTLTIDEHDMLVGNMVQFASTGTLPAPLVANKSYYVTATTMNTFKLSDTYAHAVAETNIIDITSAGTGVLTIVPLQTREIQIINNEIVDDDRQLLLLPLYDHLSGIYWSDVKSKTVGLGWHEVGDVIYFTQDSVTVRAFLHEVHLTLAGNITEELVSKVPDLASINYQAAGGIMKTIYNTEIKVDKQAQEITSVVSRQTEFEGEVQADFSQVYQDIDEITLTVQKAGGGNLLLNSVGFAKEATLDADDVNYDRLMSWQYPENYSIADHGTVTSSDSSETQNYGGISGRIIKMSTDYIADKTVSLTQRVNVAVNTPMSIGLRVRNPLGQGSAKVTISNTNESFEINIPDTEAFVWQELTLEEFSTSMSWVDVKIEASAANFQFTDLRLLYGNTLQGWVQSNSEILATNVQFTTDGMRIFDESHDTETRVTYNEFSTRRRTDGVVLFEADDVGVVTNDLTVKGATSYRSGDEIVIKQVTIPTTSPLAGIAFVKG